MDIQPLITGAEKVIQHLKETYAHLQLGRATTSLVEHMQIYVPSRGTTTGLNSLANVSIMDAQTIKIEPYSKSELKIIEKGIIESDLGFNPLNQGDYIMIKVPALTTERRQELTKIVHKEAEESKVAIRNLRHDARNDLDKQFKAKEISENEKDATEKNIDETTKKYNEKIEDLAKTKSEEVMKV
jgi:ribosome recycling factor